MNEIILATYNTGKLLELQQLLAPIRCVPQASLSIPEVDETGLSFIENAIIKARHASKFGQKPALADDSGLVVPALSGKPGIYSARFAGKGATSVKNIELLLEKMQTVPQSERQAYFYCALALVKHAEDPTPIIAIGECHGIIGQTPQGDSGFGYDPIFIVDDYACTFAQLPMLIKNTISHRAKALQQLKSSIKNLMLNMSHIQTI